VTAREVTGVLHLKGSFRDPSGHIFVDDGVVFRQIHHSYQTNYDLLMESGLYDCLIEHGLLVSHEEVPLEAGNEEKIYKVILPENIPFISYPYEWSFSQLKDAAQTTLEIQKKALEFGMTLKDSSAYNIQFLNGRPVLIDTLSFEKYKEGDPWVAYRQFCQHFLAPLAIMSYTNVAMGQLSRIYIDGIPLPVASSLLPLRTQIKPGLQIHIHLHARLQGKPSGKIKTKEEQKKSFSNRSFLGLIDSLESTVRGLRWRLKKSQWSHYYEGDSYDQEGLDDKLVLVTDLLTKIQPQTVWDLGANSGLFSRLASENGIETMSFDLDPAAVEMSYLTSVQQKESNIRPLLLDLTNPSPKIGWANSERMSLAERGPADMVLALALLHHLAIAENIPLEMIAEFFRELCSWAIVEFVPKSDPKVAILLESREDIFDSYTIEDFEMAFGRFFDIESKHKIKSSERTLYLLKGK